MSSAKSEHPLKKFFMRHVWRIQQIGAISTLIITASTLAITVSDKLLLSTILPFSIGPLVALAVLGSIVICLGWLWDKKLQMWKEQNVVNVERNPYYLFKQTPKEIASYELLWFPFAETVAEIADKVGSPEKAEAMRLFVKRYGGWCKEQVASDPTLKKQVDELSNYLKSKGE
jgi:hypothetical protein